MKANLAAIAAFAIAVSASPALADAKEDLIAVDRAFAHMSQEKGYDQAYIANLALDGQTFTGSAPIKNKADAVQRFKDPKGPHSDPRIKITWVPDTGGVSADGTLGWTEGHSSHIGPGISTTGHYIDRLGQGERNLESAGRYGQHRSKAQALIQRRKGAPVRARIFHPLGMHFPGGEMRNLAIANDRF